MAWLEVHQTLPRHRKTFAAAGRLNVPRAQVVGHVVSLWLWALDNAPAGELAGLTPEAVAFAAEWEGDPDAFVAALTDTGFLKSEGDRLLINDWQEYAGKLVTHREAERIRQAKRRAEQKTAPAKDAAPKDEPVRRTYSVRTPYVTRHSTVQYSTEPPEGSTTPPPREAAPAPEAEPVVAPVTALAVPAAPKPLPTPQQELFDAFCAVMGVDPREVSKAERGQIAAAIAQLRAAGVGADEVPRLWAAFENLFDGATCTPTAVVKHLGRLRAHSRGPPLVRAGRSASAVGPNGQPVPKSWGTLKQIRDERISGGAT